MTRAGDLDVDAVIGRADVISRRLLTGFLVHLDDDQQIELTGTGAELWQALESPTSARRLAAELAELHGADHARVLTDVAAALVELIDLGAVCGR